MAASKALKRIILTLGGKGGTGKTLFNRALFYSLNKEGVKCSGFDADVENPEFSGYHPPTDGTSTKSSKAVPSVKLLNFLDVKAAKTLFTDIEAQKPDTVLIDLPGASSKDTRQLLKTFNIFKLAADLGYRLTLATVLNIDYNTINSLQWMQEFCGANADYVAVKSQFWGQYGNNFERWVKSDTRAQFQKYKGIEIELPILELSVFDVIHEMNLSFFEIDKLPFGDRILADSFLARTLPELQRAGEYLGFPVAASKTSSAKANDAKGAEAKTTDPGKAAPELVGSAPAS